MVFFLLEFALADIVINEVMYNPNQCDDHDCEWVEVYNNGNVNVNLTGWTLDNQPLDGVNIEAYSHIVFADELIDGIDNDNESFEAYWGNNDGLWNYLDGNFSAYDTALSFKNSEDIVNLTNGTYTNTLTYSPNWGADGNGYTLEKINPAGANSQENWGASLVINGTPGHQNSIYGTEGINYSLINITEFLPDPKGDDNAPMPEGEWIELYNPTNTAMDLKWMFFKDLFGHTLYITDTNVKETTIIPANEYLVVYTNGKSGFLNNNGPELLEFYDKDGNLIKNISYIDPVEGNSYAYVSGVGWQHTKPTPGQENVNRSDVKDSYLKIEKIYDLGSDKIAKFGQTIRVKAHVYKGDTTKNSIALYIENKRDRISKQSKTSVYTRYTDYTLTIPIQLKPNCNEEFEDDDYYVYIKGLDKQDKKEIEVEGITASLCQKVKSSSSSGTKSRLSYEQISFPEEIENNEEIISEIELNNDGDENIGLEIWSYVYRGSKSYSGEREENKLAVEMPSHSQKTIKLYNTVSNANPGDYKLKTKIKQINQKTAKEITEDIKLVNSKQPIKTSQDAKTSSFIKSKGIVYESSTIKANKIVPYLIIALTTLLSIILIWKR